MKESFVLYLEQKAIFEELDNEEAGLLIKAIYEYQSTGIVPELDKSIKLAFIPIKSSLDRNEQKWEAEIQKRREAGKLGGLAKANNAKQKLANLASAKSATNFLANLADNVHVNVNEHVPVNDNVNVIKDINNDNNSYKYSLLSPPSSTVVDSELFIELPLIDKSLHPIYEKDLEKWKSIYPAVNIEQEFRNMLGWLESHSKNRKTKSGINRFINGWLGRCQNKARVEEVERDSTPTSAKKVNDPNDMSTWTDDYLLAYVNGR